MARGAKKTALDNANSGYVGSQTFNQGVEEQNTKLANYLLPQYQNLVQNPGYDAATKSAITQESTGAAAAAYGGAADTAARTAARTGNEASLAPQMDALAQQKAQTMSSVNAKNQIAFGDRAKADVTEGLQGISGMYGMDMNLLAKSLGIPPEYLQQYNEAANSPSFGQQYLLGAQKAAGQVFAGTGA
jgi:hypothetical protein